MPEYILYSLLYTLYFLLSTLYSLPYTLYSILYTLYSILYTLYSILYTLYSILYTLYSILYTILHYTTIIPKALVSRVMQDLLRHQQYTTWAFQCSSLLSRLWVLSVAIY